MEFTTCANDQVNWSDIVGSKVITDGGYMGDILELGRVHIEDAKDKGELTEQDAGQVYSTLIAEAIKQAVNYELTQALRESEVCFSNAKIVELELDSARKDCKAEAECEFLKGQKDKLECDCMNDTNMTDSKISLNAAQENKLACDCCNASKLAVADVELKAAQEKLYERQADGFDDNANQKLYESQLSAWSMVFSDTSAEVVTPSLSNDQICQSYDRIRERLGNEDGGKCETLVIPQS